VDANIILLLAAEPVFLGILLKVRLKAAPVPPGGITAAAQPTGGAGAAFNRGAYAFVWIFGVIFFLG